VRLVEPDRLGRGREPIELQAAEALGPAAGSFEEAVDGARVDVADVGRRRDRAAVPRALDDPDDRLLGELGVPQERPPPLGEAALARRAVQAADALALAGPLDDREVAGAEPVEVGAAGVGAGEAGE